MKISLCLAAALAAGSCGRVSGVAAESKASEGKSADAQAASADPIQASREADDLARFLAGVPGKPGSPYLKLETEDVWKKHREAVDAAWSRAENELLGGLREFQAKELSVPPMSSGPVFYPFSGPDALVATYYFPNAPVYAFAALEPAGTLPTTEQVLGKDMKPYLTAMRSSMASVLGRSFFITHQMDQQFRGQVTDGLLLPILQLLVHTNHSIVGFRYVRLDEAGKIVPRTLDYHATTRYGNKGVHIEFKSDSDGSLHQLYYFSVNLADDRLTENKPFQAYVESLKGATTMFKSTSYMMHHKEFSVIRNLVLQNAGAVLQDDSGIPYKNFDQNVWKVQLYGDYDHPYGESFRGMEQADLKEAYHRPGIKPLPMHVGYGYRKITSNLLLATKLTAAAKSQ